MNKLNITIIALISFTSLWAQQPKDTLNTEVINVVKPYTPTISDAFKVKDNPTTPDETIEKERIDYKIKSAPVASTFTPSKGKAKGVKRPKKERLFDNYISAGFGNYTTPLFEAYIRSFPSRDTEFGVLLKHHSSQGGIKEVVLDDFFYDSNLDVYYKQSTRDMDWKLKFGAQHQLYNWYGLPETTTFDTTLLDSISPKQSYLNINLGGEIEYYDSFLKGATATISGFSDKYDSKEFRVRVQPIIEMPISSELINFQFDIDLLKGDFNRNYTNDAAIAYSYINLGVTPNFEVLRDNLSINLGAKLYYAVDLQNSIGKFKAYPNVDASYQLVEEVLTIFGGATGGMNFNTYLDFSQDNPFISPNLLSVPTDEKYRAFAGIKGKLASNMNYLFRGSYGDERNKPLYLLNRIQTDGILGVNEVYELGNTFSIVYDDVKTMSLYGELTLDFSKEFTFGGSINYASYSLENEIEAWNLPNLKTTLFADYHANKWTGTAKLFMLSDRKDVEGPFLTPLNYNQEDYIVKMGTYLDLNAEISYAFTERLSAFAKGNNLLGTKYKRFYNYQVQGIQVLGGITYKFNM
jgi:hypothetical protein